MNKVTEISGLITCQQTGEIGDPNTLKHRKTARQFERQPLKHA
jgi:hypothetical protein